MGLVDATPKVRLEVPFEPGAWFLVRELGWKELEAVREEKSTRALAKVRGMGPELVGSFRALEQGEGSEPEQAELTRAKAAHAHPSAQFDKDMLLSRSVEGWSYEEPFTKAKLERLDEATSEWLFHAIAALYGKDRETEAERGNASTPSTAA